MQLLTLAVIIALLPGLAVQPVNGYSVNLNVSSDVATTGRTTPASLFPVALALAAPAVALVLGAIKPVLLVMGLIYLALYGLTYVPVIGELLQASFRAFGAVVTDSVSPTVGQDLLRVVGLDTEACRTRAICEVTADAVRKYPTVAAMLWSLTGAIQAHGSNEVLQKGLLGGLSGLGCESLYSTCAQSPFDRLLRTMRS